MVTGGAVAKSNFTTLRYREPVYRSLRELVMSYFDFYFNIDGDKSLRSYSLPLDLTIYNFAQVGKLLKKTSSLSVISWRRAVIIRW